VLQLQQQALLKVQLLAAHQLQLQQQALLKVQLLAAHQNK
jgi:hypothetical protein